MVKVTVLGAAGGIGQPISLLMKSNPLVTDLALYDVVNALGVAADLSHINTPANVTGYVGQDVAQLEAAIAGAHLIVIPAGVPRKPGMTRDDLFNINAGIVAKLAAATAKVAPKAFVCIISNPVNSTVPIFAEVMKKHGVFDPKRIFGVTTLDLVRASAFVSQVKGTDVLQTKIDVIGGHSGATIVPVLSSAGPFTEEQRTALVQRIQFGGDEVVKAKDGAGSATLSMAYAGARFANAILDATVLKKSGLTECSYIFSDVAKAHGCDYFSTVVEFGVNGVEKVHPIPALDAHEQKLLEACCAELKGSIQKGVDFVQKANL